MLHDFDQPGASVVYNFNISRYVAGAGLDLTRYEKKALVPICGDLRLKMPLSKMEPYIVGQVGYTFYSNEANYAGAPSSVNADIKGGMFYSPGIGLAFRRPKVGFFVQYNHRFYSFDAEQNPQIPSTYTPDMDLSPSIGMLTAGDCVLI